MHLFRHSALLKIVAVLEDWPVRADRRMGPAGACPPEQVPVAHWKARPRTGPGRSRGERAGGANGRPHPTARTRPGSPRPPPREDHAPVIRRGAGPPALLRPGGRANGAPAAPAGPAPRRHEPVYPAPRSSSRASSRAALVAALTRCGNRPPVRHELRRATGTRDILPNRQPVYMPCLRPDPGFTARMNSLPGSTP